MAAQAEDKDLNMQVVVGCVKKIEEGLNKAATKGVFDLSESHLLYECYAVIAKTVDRCELLQKKMALVMRQQELLQQTDGAPVPPS